MTLYVPGPVLREGSNEVVLLEVERAARDTAGEPCVRGWAGMSSGLLTPWHELRPACAGMSSGLLAAAHAACLGCIRLCLLGVCPAFRQAARGVAVYKPPGLGFAVRSQGRSALLTASPNHAPLLTLPQWFWTTRPTSGAPRAQWQSPHRRRAAAACRDRSPPRLCSTAPTFPLAQPLLLARLHHLLLVWRSVARMHASALTRAGAGQARIF